MNDERIQRLVACFHDHFPEHQNALFLAQAPGRTELLGNHTDHQQGKVLCAAVDLTMTACVAPSGGKRVRVVSEGFGGFELLLDDLAPRGAEKGTSQSLVRGIAAAFAEKGFDAPGFDAYITSDVLSGSGLSSSAAFEILIATIFDHLCRGGFSAADKAKMGQWAENRYFDKPCGLMDQMACSVGGAVCIDFAEASQPVCERLDFDLSAHGYTLCIVNTNSSHEDLTEAYAAIPREMGSVAAWFGKNVLRQVPEEAFLDALPEVRKACGDRAVLRAMHFFDENRRVTLARDALNRDDLPGYFELVNASGRSSELLLQNIWAYPHAQAVTLALAFSRKLLGGSGAVRVHGGGFAGTIQAYVPNELCPAFSVEMERVFGSGTCYALQIRPNGGEIIHI